MFFSGCPQQSRDIQKCLEGQISFEYLVAGSLCTWRAPASSCSARGRGIWGATAMLGAQISTAGIAPLFRNKIVGTSDSIWPVSGPAFIALAHSQRTTASATSSVGMVAASEQSQYSPAVSDTASTRLQSCRRGGTRLCTTVQMFHVIQMRRFFMFTNNWHLWFLHPDN
jgi:hypothetical protein